MTKKVSLPHYCSTFRSAHLCDHEVKHLLEEIFSRELAPITHNTPDTVLELGEAFFNALIRRYRAQERSLKSTLRINREYFQLLAHSLDSESESHFRILAQKFTCPSDITIKYESFQDMIVCLPNDPEFDQLYPDGTSYNYCGQCREFCHAWQYRQYRLRGHCKILEGTPYDQILTFDKPCLLTAPNNSTILSALHDCYAEKIKSQESQVKTIKKILSLLIELQQQAPNRPLLPFARHPHNHFRVYDRLAVVNGDPTISLDEYRMATVSKVEPLFVYFVFDDENENLNSAHFNFGPIDEARLASQLTFRLESTSLNIMYPWELLYLRSHPDFCIDVWLKYANLPILR